MDPIQNLFYEGQKILLHHPKGPSAQHLRTLVPNSLNCMVFGTRNLKYWVIGPSGVMAAQAAEAAASKGLEPRYFGLRGAPALYYYYIVTIISATTIVGYYL